jgi:hypothetical protein
VFGQREVISSSELIDQLTKKVDASADWNRCNRGTPISYYWLREHVNGVLVPPTTVKVARAVHGYKRVQFVDAWQRYLGCELPEETSEDSEGPESSDASGAESSNQLETKDNLAAPDAEPDAKTASGAAKKRRKSKANGATAPDAPDQTVPPRSAEKKTRRAPPPKPGPDWKTETWE